MYKTKFLPLFLFLTFRVFSQNTDSIYNTLTTINNDSVKIALIINKIISPLKAKGQYLKAESELLKAKRFVNGNKNIDFKIKSTFVDLLIAQEKYDEANDSIDLFLNKALKQKNIYYEAMFLRSKAEIQMYLGELDKSSELFFKALDKCLETKDLRAITTAYSDLAAINFYNEQYAKACEYWEKSIELYPKEDRKDFVANNLSNLGIAYIENNDLKNGETRLNKALNIANEINDEAIKASIYMNLTKLEYVKKNYNKAIDYSNKAAKYYESVNSYNQLSTIYSNNAELARTNKQYNEALVYLDKAFKTMLLTENKMNESALYLNKAAIYYDLKDYLQAYENLKKYINIKDSTVTLENRKNITELEKKYQLSERKKENALLNEQINTQELASSRLKITISLISIILLIIIFVAFWAIKQNRLKNKINAQLSEKNAIINIQKAIVEEQNQDITDSIKYAQRIQGAILPPKNMWQNILPNSFVLYMPKDILSGDFYWIEETKDYIYVAAADCTGHGVPGALVSIINFNLLNKAVLEKGLVSPSEILDAVNIWLTESLHQTYRESAVKDGMDVSLIAIHKHSNEVLFAGANNPIYHLHHGELKQIKGDKFPVGAFIEDQIQKFTTKRFTVAQGDSIYLFSDGFADQFGGDNGKKYKYLPFQKKLCEFQELSLSEQRNKMREEFLKWKGEREQVDDVLLIGIKIV